MNTSNEKQKKSVFDRNPILTGLTISIFIILLIDFFAALFLIKSTDKAVLRLRARVAHPHYHHDLLPNLETQDLWGNVLYDLTTNDLGFRSNKTGSVPLVSTQYRLVIIGDSFTEGVGVPYDSTFVGLLEKHYTDFSILNAGIVSYSPKLYFLKTRYLLEQKNLKFNELLVCIDISDIQDEIDYKDYVPSQSPFGLSHRIKRSVQTYLIRNSFIANIYYKIKYYTLTDEQLAWYESRDEWGMDEEVYKDWGATGIQSAVNYMDSLHQLCLDHKITLTIAAHPWPTQVVNHALNGREITIWKEFADNRSINLINHFPSFVDSIVVDTSAFIPGDIHWNVKGHQKIARNIIKSQIFPDSMAFATFLGLPKVHHPQ